MYQLLVNNPESFAQHIITNPELKNTFAGLDLVALSKRLKEAEQ
jgi:hypothetical protein